MVYQSDDREYPVPLGSDAEHVRDMLERLLTEINELGERVLLIEVDWQYNMYFFGRPVGRTLYDRYQYHPDNLVTAITETLFTPT